MAKTNETTALRKRTQIDKTNKLVFIWVACASVLASASIVLIIMMVQKGVHTQKAINELHNTVDTLRSNNDSIPQLEDQVRALASNEALLSLRNNDTDNALRVVLDALPADSNPSALGASLQDKLFGNVTVESIRVTPLSSDSDEGLAPSEGQEDVAASNVGVIPFQFTVHGSAKDIKNLFERLQRSVRTIEIGNVKMESESNGKQKLTVAGQAYYLPAYVLQLQTKEIEP